MLKQAAGNINANRVADAALAASRQVWLAGLGAAVVTREWARNDAGHMFRALVREGSTVESRAIRVIGRRIESSVALATTAWSKLQRPHCRLSRRPPRNASARSRPRNRAVPSPAFRGRPATPSATPDCNRVAIKSRRRKASNNHEVLHVRRGSAPASQRRRDASGCSLTRGARAGGRRAARRHL
jgi:hypothetical protein